MAVTASDRIDDQENAIYRAFGGANEAVPVTLSAPGADKRWSIEGIAWSLTADPNPAVELSISVAGVTVWSVIIDKSGFDQWKPPGVLQGGANEVVVVTLGADAGGGSGRVNVQAKQLRAA